MGQDAKAYLWFGTKPLRGCPSRGKFAECSKLGPGEAADAVGRMLPTGVMLVYIPESEGKGLWALGISGTYHYHDWDNEAKRFELMNPWPDQCELLIHFCQTSEWPYQQGELGWYQGATYW